MQKKNYLVLLSLILAGCGGGSDDKDSTTPVQVNTPPKLTSATIETLNGIATDLNLTDLVSDADGDSISIVSLGDAQHGTLSSSGMTVYYDPDDSFAGTDSFTVTIGDGKDNVTETMNVSAFQGLTLKGKVVDEPVPGALVSIELNGLTFNAVADENGDYSVEIKTTDTTQFVTVKATGDADDTSGIMLINLLGETASLLEKTNGSYVLGDNPEDTTNVTNMTTARYVLAKEANGGEEITSDAQLIQAEKSIDANQLIEIAAVIKVILDDPNYALPEGFSDVLEFVSNSDAYNEFVEEVQAMDPNDNPLTKAIADISKNPELVQGFTANTLSHSYILATAAAPGFLARGGDLMELNEDGTGAFTNNYGQSKFSWNLTDGELKLTFDSPVSSYGFYDVYQVLTTSQADQYVSEYGTWQIGGTYSTTSQTYTRLIDGNQIDTVSISSASSLVYDEVYLNGVKVDITPIVEEGTSQQLMRDGDAIAPLAIVADDLLESWAVPTYYQSSYGLTYNGDLLEFNTDGSGQAVLSERTFSWQLADNTVNITFSDKSRLVAQKLDGIDELSALALKTYDANGALLAFDYSFATWHDDVNSNLSADNLVNDDGHFWATFVNGWNARYWKEGEIDFVQGSGFGFDFNADGTNETINYFYSDPDADPKVIDKTVLPGTWQIGTDIDEKLLSFTRCYEPNYCQRREWLGLQVTDSQLIVLERAFNPDGNGGEVLVIPPRLNIYRDWEKLPESTPAKVQIRKSIIQTNKLPTHS